MQLSIGTDPELVIRTKDGKPVAAPLHFPWFKDKPLDLPWCQAFCDNANIELTLPPAITEEQFLQYLQSALAQVHDAIGPDHYLSATSSLNYPLSQLESHPVCKEFGCEPDFNAWNVSINPSPVASNQRLRSCGGHVHVGNAGGADFLKDFPGKIQATKAMDLVLGTASLLLDDDPAAIRRRELYGKAGAHRPKNYGVEYRSLSNFWIRHPELSRFVYRGTHTAMHLVKDGNLEKIDLTNLEATINNGDKKQAEEYVKQVSELYPDHFLNMLDAMKHRSSRSKFSSLRKSWSI